MLNFVSHTRKTAQTKVVTRKYVIMIRNKYFHDFWKTVFCFALSALELYVGVLTMIICQRRSQLGKNKEIILHLTKKIENMFKKKARTYRVKQGRASTYFLCFKILTRSNKNWEHQRSKLNIFQEICLTLLSSLEVFFTKCVSQMIFFMSL